MRIVNPRTFQQEDLPAIIADSARLHTFFITYNTVDGHPAGQVETGLPGLSISVHSGDEKPGDLDELFLLLYGDPVAQLHMAIERDGEARRDMARVEENLGAPREHASTDSKPLVILYVGLHAWEESAEYAIKLREQLPEATIVMLACDCDWPFKAASITRLHEMGVVDKLIKTSACGGRRVMAELLETTRAHWRAKLDAKTSATATA